MHKTNYVKLYQVGGLLGGVGSFFGGLFGAKKPQGQQTNEDLQARQLDWQGKSMQASSAVNPQGKSGLFSNMTSGQATGLLTSGATTFAGIQNAQQLNSPSQRASATADAAVNGVSSALSAFGPWGTVAGLGLKLVNGIGGSLMNHNSTAKAADAFTVNNDIQQSSGYAGIASGAADAKADGGAYKKAGLFGKLATNTGALKSEFNASNVMQSQGANVLNTNKQAMQAGANSVGMVSNNLQQKNYNSGAWNNGSVMFGMEGGTLNSSGSTDPKIAQYHKLKVASKQVNLRRMKGITAKQQGGVMQQDNTRVAKVEEDKNHGYTKWIQSLPDRLRETNDYDLKGYFDKYGAVKVEGDNHLTDEYKKPNHVTFSSESIYNSPEHQGGEWRKAADGKWEFVASPWNVKNTSVDSLQEYFKLNEPGARLILPPAKHEEGGPINVIADGALHARKHTLKEIPELADANITNKGIPVVSEGEGGEIIQHAEVERDELILHYDLTKQLEDLFEEGTDEAAIKAGKLLSREIVKNTRDSRSKIIKNG